MRTAWIGCQTLTAHPSRGAGTAAVLSTTTPRCAIVRSRPITSSAAIPSRQRRCLRCEPVDQDKRVIHRGGEIRPVLSRPATFFATFFATVCAPLHKVAVPVRYVFTEIRVNRHAARLGHICLGRQHFRARKPVERQERRPVRIGTMKALRRHKPRNGQQHVDMPPVIGIERFTLRRSFMRVIHFHHVIGGRLVHRHR